MADFLNGDIFGYLLHAAEVLIALALFTVGLKRRRLFPLRVVVVCLLYLALAVGLGLLFERYFPVIRYLCAFLLSLTLIPLCYRVEVWDGLFRARLRRPRRTSPIPPRRWWRAWAAGIRCWCSCPMRSRRRRCIWRCRR